MDLVPSFAQTGKETMALNIKVCGKKIREMARRADVITIMTNFTSVTFHKTKDMGRVNTSIKTTTRSAI